ncbi:MULTISPECIES: hypothetical protein [Streptomyces]|uniref:hypothetical protein n=1 Tax=Streptomyces TaxID=1883 RepID=UPI000F7B8E20|nr:hypothetical protein [Streptomyces sp. WAC05858]RSS44160.1 hypothetical protein EF902_16700 [Streptomyces sp. WAC05858]
MSWAWEYDPSEDHVAGGAPPALIAEVEKKADELVRAAAALYLDGPAYQGPSPRGENVLVPGGMFFCQVVPRHECVYLLQITAW